VTDAKPYRHRFPMTIIQHAVRLYHRFPLSYRDVQELLYRRGIVVSHETLREWCIKFGPLFAEDLRHREPRRGSRWHLDEVCTSVDGVRHWLRRAVDEYGFVLDVLLQRHRDTEAARTFLTRLLGEYDVPEVIHTDQLRSYGAAIREIPSLINVDHQQVVSTARCNNIIEQEHRSTRRQERSGQAWPAASVLPKKSAGIQAAETRSRIPKPTRSNHQPPPPLPNQRLRLDQTT
jgi:putative transposase